MVSAIEAVPAQLGAVADAVTVHFPWGSLLRGALRAEPAVLEPLAGLARCGATLTLLVSLTERDRAAGLAPLDADRANALAQAYPQHGFALLEFRRATHGEIAASRSRWAKRLAVGRAREAWLLRFRRTEGRP